MANLSFDPEYRRLWICPRNIRRIEPMKLHQVLTVLMKCADYELGDNQDQKYVYAMLDESGIKKKANTRVSNPGGMRTYYAQLEMLGLIYKNAKGKFCYTIAGKELSDGNEMQKVLQYQLLRHQYPSAYGMNQNVKIDPRMRVKPFLFLIKLLHDPRLNNYLTCKDITVPVIYGHDDDCYEKCVIKILKLRKNRGEIESVIDNFLCDLYTPRSGMGKNINNVLDIANTFKNYLEASGLIYPLARINGEQRYCFDTRYERIYETLENESFLKCETIDEAEAFQRSYGRFLYEEDKRSEEECMVRKESPEVAFVQFRYALYASMNPFNVDTEFFKEMEGMGIDESIVADAITPYNNVRKTIDANNFLDYSTANGEKMCEFRTSLVNLFKSMGFVLSDTVVNIEEKPGIVYLLLESISQSKRCFIVANNSPCYVFEPEDIPCRLNFNKPNYYLVVAGGFNCDMNHFVLEVSSNVKAPVTALSARTLLDLYEECKEKGESNKFIFSILEKGGYVTDEELFFRGE